MTAHIKGMLKKMTVDELHNFINEHKLPPSVYTSDKK